MRYHAIMRKLHTAPNGMYACRIDGYDGNQMPLSKFQVRNAADSIIRDNYLTIESIIDRLCKDAECNPTDLTPPFKG